MGEADAPSNRIPATSVRQTRTLARARRGSGVRRHARAGFDSAQVIEQQTAHGRKRVGIAHDDHKAARGPRFIERHGG